MLQLRLNYALRREKLRSTCVVRIQNGNFLLSRTLLMQRTCMKEGRREIEREGERESKREERERERERERGERREERERERREVRNLEGT